MPENIFLNFVAKLKYKVVAIYIFLLYTPVD